MASTDGDSGAGLCQSLRDGETDSPGASRDNRIPSVQKGVVHASMLRRSVEAALLDSPVP